MYKFHSSMNRYLNLLVLKSFELRRRLKTLLQIIILIMSIYKHFFVNFYSSLVVNILRRSFFLAIFEQITSIGFVVSYNTGACKIIDTVPTIQANVNIHKNNLSSTIATYFQSSITCNRNSKNILIEFFRLYDIFRR